MRYLILVAVMCAACDDDPTNSTMADVEAIDAGVGMEDAWGPELDDMDVGDGDGDGEDVPRLCTPAECPVDVAHDHDDLDAGVE